MKVCNDSEKHIEYFRFTNTIFENISPGECSKYQGISFTKYGRNIYGIFSSQEEKFVITKNPIDNFDIFKIRFGRNYIGISDISFYEDRPIYTLHPGSLTIE